MAEPLAARLARAYGGLRASFRAESAPGPTEARLLFYAMLACLLLWAGRLPALMADIPEAVLREAGGPAAYAGATFVSHVLFGPLALYGLAGLSRLAARAAGGRGTWAGARLALFWAVLLAAPLALLAGAALTVAGLAGGAAARVVTALPALAGLWFWALFLAEAEGFGQPRLVFLVLLAVPVAAAALTSAAALG